MIKITFGTPEKYVPSIFCKNFNYTETKVSYPVEKISFKINARGCRLEFPLSQDEHIYGLGLQLNAFDLRKKKMVLRVNSDPITPTGDSHAPVPFFVSTRGYGIYIDSARYLEYDFGAVKANSASKEKSENGIAVSTDELYGERKSGSEEVIAVQIPIAKGADVYIIEGKNITEVVSRYNMMSGGGCEVPEWGLEPFYRCCSKYSQSQITETAEYLRSNDIPCGILGLEPGWQSHAYSCSYLWNKELFPDPEKMLVKLKEMGFHVSLWEHAFTHESSPIYKTVAENCGDYKVFGGLVPDFTVNEVSKAFAEFHRDKVMYGIVDGFKLDECDGSDFIKTAWSFPLCSEFPGGLDGEQYHSLFGVLYMQTILKALGDTKTLSEVRNAGALSASYPFVLYSDLYNHKNFIRGLATAGFSGLLWTPEVRHADSAEDFIRRLQTVVYSPQCLINGWYCDKLPWINHGCEDKVRELLKERERIIPKLKEAFDRYHITGIAPVRAVVSDYSDDAETYGIDDEYLFCDDMLVAPMVKGEKSRKVYLPEGSWTEIHTGRTYGKGWITEETDNIPVYRKNKTEF